VAARRYRSRRIGGVALALALALALAALGAVLVERPASAATVAVKVQGNQLVDGAGNPVRLLGVNRSGPEYACVDGFGIFDGPSDATSVAAIASWHTNAVRVALNEDCWLGINGVPAAFSGANYQNAIGQYVSTLHAAGLAVILNLEINAPGSTKANSLQVMADADHSPAFWSSVATFFKSDPGVVFDVITEPHDISWTCWRDGCTTAAGWKAAGMQSLVDAVRGTGATQPIILGGLGYSSDLSQWLAFKPVDPAGQLAASFHTYNFSGCSTQSCWDSTVAPVAMAVPVVTGEFGEDDCATGYINPFMAWADAHGISYLAWTWDAGGGWTCTGGPTVITSYDGTPTNFGVGLRDHLAALASGPPPPGGGTGAGTLSGAVYKGGSAKPKKALAGVSVLVNGVAAATTTASGTFSVSEPAGTYTESVSLPGRVCHANTKKGPTSQSVTLADGATSQVSWFCGKK